MRNLLSNLEGVLIMHEPTTNMHGRRVLTTVVTAILFMLLLSIPAAAQEAVWTLGSGSSATYTAGSVGMGTSSPNSTATAHVVNNNGTGNPTILAENLGDAAGNIHLTSHRTNAGNAGIFRFKYFDSGANLVEAGTVAGTILNIAPGTRAGGLIFSTQSTAATTATEKMRIDGAGNVGIGTTSPTAKLHVVGNSTFTGNATFSGTVTGGNISATYQDVAEWVPSSEELATGTVVVLDSERSNSVIASSTPYDTRVAGAISATPGVLLGVPGEGKVKVATTGRVKVRVHSDRAVKIGDLLVSSGEQGVAMVSEPVDLGGVKIHRPGTLIGKALEPMAAGSGEILVLLSLQ
jgi:hypothetical protein